MYGRADRSEREYESERVKGRGRKSRASDSKFSSENLEPARGVSALTQQMMKGSGRGRGRGRGRGYWDSSPWPNNKSYPHHGNPSSGARVLRRAENSKYKYVRDPNSSTPTTNTVSNTNAKEIEKEEVNKLFNKQNVNNRNDLDQKINLKNEVEGNFEDGSAALPAAQETNDKKRGMVSSDHSMSQNAVQSTSLKAQADCEPRIENGFGKNDTTEKDEASLLPPSLSPNKIVNSYEKQSREKNGSIERKSFVVANTLYDAKLSSDTENILNQPRSNGSEVDETITINEKGSNEQKTDFVSVSPDSIKGERNSIGKVKDASEEDSGVDLHRKVSNEGSESLDNEGKEITECKQQVPYRSRFATFNLDCSKSDESASDYSTDEGWNEEVSDEWYSSNSDSSSVSNSSSDDSSNKTNSFKKSSRGYKEKKKSRRKEECHSNEGSEEEEGMLRKASSRRRRRIRSSNSEDDTCSVASSTSTVDTSHHKHSRVPCEKPSTTSRIHRLPEDRGDRRERERSPNLARSSDSDYRFTNSEEDKKTNSRTPDEDKSSKTGKCNSNLQDLPRSEGNKGNKVIYNWSTNKTETVNQRNKGVFWQSDNRYPNRYKNEQTSSHSYSKPIKIQRRSAPYYSEEFPALMDIKVGNPENKFASMPLMDYSKKASKKSNGILPTPKMPKGVLPTPNISKAILFTPKKQNAFLPTPKKQNALLPTPKSSHTNVRPAENNQNNQNTNVLQALFGKNDKPPSNAPNRLEKNSKEKPRMLHVSEVERLPIKCGKNIKKEEGNEQSPASEVRKEQTNEDFAKPDQSASAEMKSEENLIAIDPPTCNYTSFLAKHHEQNICNLLKEIEIVGSFVNDSDDNMMIDSKQNASPFLSQDEDEKGVLGEEQQASETSPEDPGCNLDTNEGEAKEYRFHVKDDILMMEVLSIQDDAITITERISNSYGIFKSHWSPTDEDIWFWKDVADLLENDQDVEILNVDDEPTSLAKHNACGFDCYFSTGKRLIVNQ